MCVRRAGAPLNAIPRLDGTRVLVTGGLGFIGSNLARACVDLGAAVTICDVSDPQSGANPENLAGYEERVTLVRADIRSRDEVAPLVRGSDIVFNCAAFTSHSISMREPLRALEVNCAGTVALLEAAREGGASTRFIQLGTSTQIGRMLHEPVTEEHPEFPRDVYSATKSAAEKLALVYREAHGLRVTCVRLANVYGPRAHIRTPDLGFMNYFIGLALQDRELTVYGDGAQLRNVTFVDDAVSALLLVATADAPTSAVLFAVSDEHCTVREIADAIVAVIGTGRVKRVEWPNERAAIDVGAARISNERITAELGWTAATALRDGLARTRDYFRPRLEAYL